MAKRTPTDAASPDQVFEGIAGLVDAFCREHLNAEYADLCRRLAEKLACKRPSPLVSGKPNTWACGIVRTIGWANFLDDRSQKPHMKLTVIDKAFGVGESTGQGKSMLIRKMLKIRPMDPVWSLRSRMGHNPMSWMIQVNGFLVDARFLKREIQEEGVRFGPAVGRAKFAEETRGLRPEPPQNVRALRKRPMRPHVSLCLIVKKEGVD